MSRIVLTVFAAAVVALATAPQPASAASGLPVVPATPTERIERTTAPFDPICPLCFVREFLESLS